MEFERSHPFSVVYSRLGGRNIRPLFCAMAIPVFSPSAAGAASTCPLVCLAPVSPKPMCVYGTKRTCTRMACTRSPVDAPQGECPRTLGRTGPDQYRGTHPDSIHDPYYPSFRVGHPHEPTHPMRGVPTGVEPIQRRTSARSIQPLEGLGEFCLASTANGMGLECHPCFPSREYGRSRFLRGRSTRRPSSSQRNVCQHPRPMESTLGGTFWTRFLGIWTLSLCLLGTLQAQPNSLIQAAMDRFQSLHPMATLAEQDSVLALMQSWISAPCFINRWPRDRLDDIPFLSPKSSFQLGRYIAELGYLIDPNEWAAIALDSIERLCLQSMFDVGFPASNIQSLRRIHRWGLQLNSSGWQPYVIGHGIRWSHRNQFRLDPYVWNGHQPSGPWLHARELHRIWAWAPMHGGYYLQDVSSSWMLGMGHIKDQLLFASQWTHTHGFLRAQVFGRHSFGLHCKWTWANGMQWEWSLRHPRPELSQAWLPFPLTQGVTFRLPWQRGSIEIAHRGRQSWLRFSNQRQSWSLEQWDGMWRLATALDLSPTLCWRFYGSVHPSVPEAFALAWSHASPKSTMRVQAGYMGTGMPYAYGTSPLRMSQAGAYLSLYWVHDGHLGPTERLRIGPMESGRLECTVRLRPGEGQFSVRYSFQSDQK